MTTLKLQGNIDLEALNAACEGITAPVRIGVDDGELTLMLEGADAVGCAEVLAELLETSGIETMQTIC